MTLTEFLDRLQALVDQAAELPPRDLMVALQDQAIAKEGEAVFAEMRGDDQPGSNQRDSA